MMLSEPYPTPKPLPALNELGRRGRKLPNVTITANTSMSNRISPFDRSSGPILDGSGLTSPNLITPARGVNAASASCG